MLFIVESGNAHSNTALSNHSDTDSDMFHKKMREMTDEYDRLKREHELAKKQIENFQAVSLASDWVNINILNFIHFF